MLGRSRPISWLKSARKEFEAFPAGARERTLQALDIAAAGGMAGIAKPLKGFGSGIFEVALKYRTDAFRLVYAVQVGDAFQKKSTSGIKTSQADLDLVRQRIKQLMELVSDGQR
ncbi:type II toxin-antitoxin system RelE/ParE family toxin [Methylobacterium indicum]|uniref:type II toxin-antitoxin system RelE/ParE family toxin n=1 Tax=Methylobacterium indicum TaxID=1775910 RepID=UPI002435814F|nr:type II toxin-antitoxin system RelE/ParE family toxin [Methylobacterium indicum]